MSRDVFRRFLLIVGCTAYVVALAFVWIHVGWFVALLALVGGMLFAVALSVEPTSTTPLATVASVKPQGLSIREISRRARGGE